jgi:hypothetical protein
MKPKKQHLYNKFKNTHDEKTLLGTSKNIEKKIEKEIIEKPLDDSELKYYLNNPKIIKYSELKNYSNIDELLNNNNDYVIILIEQKLNEGHWVCLLKYNDTLEFFDSLGGSPDSQLEWSIENNENLGQNVNFLTKLLMNSNYNVIYNKIKFQSQGNKRNGNNINSCGRHCCWRIINLMKNDKDLKKYIDFMKDIKKNSKNTYDEIVSHLINDFIKIE